MLDDMMIPPSFDRPRSAPSNTYMHSSEPQRQDENLVLDPFLEDYSNMPPKSILVVRKQSVSAPVSPSSRFKHLSGDSQPQPDSPSQSSSGPASPILRWFHNKISLHSPPPLSRPQTPHSAALSEAMHDHLPTRPEPAHLPPEYHANIRPPIINELARCTLPTSSLITPAGRHHTSDSADPLLLDRIPPSAPARSSLDTLRTLYNKGIPATPLHQQTRSISIPAPFRNWFQTEPAKDEDKHKSILTEEDRDEDPEVERENIRRKCRHSSVIPTIFSQLNSFQISLRKTLSCSAMASLVSTL